MSAPAVSFPSYSVATVTKVKDGGVGAYSHARDYVDFNRYMIA